MSRVSEAAEVPRVIGDFPPVLYRAFDTEKYARAIVDRGAFRMGMLQHYTSIEDDVRRDDSEGLGKLSIPGDVTHVGLGPDREILQVFDAPGRVNVVSVGCNASYLLCCSCPEVDGSYAGKADFGRWLVKISDVQQLCQDITDSLYSGAAELAGVAFCVPVRYDKNGEVSVRPSTVDLAALAYAQKPESFSVEREVRIAVTVGVLASMAQMHLDIDLDKSLSYAEVLELRSGL